MARWLRAMAVVGLCFGCGGSTSTPPPPPPPPGGGAAITISSYAYSPANLMVNPGDSVTVTNSDSVPHSVTSEATATSYTPGSVAGISFDTGPFTGTRSFSIPSSAPHGTVIPYYCTVHGRMMANTATITIR